MKTLDPADIATYAFIEAMHHVTRDRDIGTEAALAERMGVPRGNLREWIDAGVDEGSLVRADASGQPGVRFTTAGLRRWTPNPSGHPVRSGGTRPDGGGTTTPCTTTIVVTHHMPDQGTDGDPEVLISQIEFMHEDGCDPRSEAIAAMRKAHDDGSPAAGSLLQYDIQDHEWRLAETSAVLIGHHLPTLA